MTELLVSFRLTQSKTKGAAGGVTSGTSVSGTIVMVPSTVPIFPHSSSAVQVTVITPPTQISKPVLSRLCVIVI